MSHRDLVTHDLLPVTWWQGQDSKTAKGKGKNTVITADRPLILTQLRYSGEKKSHSFSKPLPTCRY